MRKREKITYDSPYDLEGSLDAAIAHLQQRAAEFKKQGWEDVKIELETCYGYYDDSWIEVSYYGTKPITVKEFLDSDKLVVHADQLKTKKKK